MPNYRNGLSLCTRSWNEPGVSETPCGNKSMAPSWIQNVSAKPLFLLKSLYNVSYGNHSSIKQTIAPIAQSSVWLNVRDLPQREMLCQAAGSAKQPGVTQTSSQKEVFKQLEASELISSSVFPKRSQSVLNYAYSTQPWYIQSQGERIGPRGFTFSLKSRGNVQPTWIVGGSSPRDFCTGNLTERMELGCATRSLFALLVCVH